MNSSLPLRVFLISGCLSLPALIASARVERVVEKTFSVSAAGILRLETQGGEIRVMPSNDSMVKVTARQRFRTSSETEADEVLKKLDLVIEQNGNDVRAVARYERAPWGFHFGSWPPVQVDFTVSAPANFATDLHTSGGSITVGDLNGKVNARTSGGSIKLGKIGAEIDARTSGGSITLDEANGPVKAETSGGNITAGCVAGPAELATSGGSIKINSVADSIRAHTSGGSIRAGIAGPLKEDSTLSTSGGSVRVTVAKTAAFRLDASTSGGGVDAEGLTITIDKGSHGKTRLAGTVNGGGPALKLRTSGGNIVVRVE